MFFNLNLLHKSLPGPWGAQYSPVLDRSSCPSTQSGFWPPRLVGPLFVQVNTTKLPRIFRWRKLASAVVPTLVEPNPLGHLCPHESRMNNTHHHSLIVRSMLNSLVTNLRVALLAWWGQLPPLSSGWRRVMLPDSDEMRTTLLLYLRRPALTRRWMTKTVAIELVVYMRCSSSHFGPLSKPSVVKWPAVMICSR